LHHDTHLPPLPSVPPQALSLVPRDTWPSRMLHDLLNKIRLQRSSYMRLRVAAKGDSSESAFFSLLVEDR
jgi:protein transport protein SEC24